MGLMRDVRREFIAVPDTHKGQIVYKWPDQNIRKFNRYPADGRRMEPHAGGNALDHDARCGATPHSAQS
jgi:hypothetical protein